MPRPTLIGASDAAAASSAPAATGEPYIFVSYSHKDASLAEEFLSRFRVCAKVIGVTDEHVFFDRNRILAGDQWNSALDEALARATFFVFLVSFDSLGSGCCMNKELAAAARRAIPIVPVILKPCAWEKQPIPGIEKTLDRLNPLPVAKGQQASELMPVTKWEHRDEAWVAVMDALCRKLESLVAPRASAKQAAPAPSADLDMERRVLAFRCDQVKATGDFRDGLAQWQGQTLVVLAKGIYDDDLAGFWSRLEFDYLRRNHRIDCAPAIVVALLDPARDVMSMKELMKRTAAEMRAAINQATSADTASTPSVGPQTTRCLTPLLAFLPSATEPLPRQNNHSVFARNARYIREPRGAGTPCARHPDRRHRPARPQAHTGMAPG
jgi:hypothetical protein